MAQKYWQRSGAIRKRKGSKIRRSAKRRLQFGKKPRISRSLVRGGVHFFRRFGFYSGAPFTTDANGEFFGCIFANGLASINFQPGGIVAMPSVSEFTSLFDQYKIMSFTVEFRPRWNGADVNNINTTSPFLPTIYYVHDTDSYSAPTTVSELMERKNVKAVRLTKPVYMTVKFPCVQQMIYQSALSTSYGPRKAPWLDFTNYQVPMAGILYAIVGKPSTNFPMDIRVRWNFMCKNQR